MDWDPRHVDLIDLWLQDVHPSYEPYHDCVESLLLVVGVLHSTFCIRVAIRAAKSGVTPVPWFWSSLTDESL